MSMAAAASRRGRRDRQGHASPLPKRRRDPLRGDRAQSTESSMSLAAIAPISTSQIAPEQPQSRRAPGSPWMSQVRPSRDDPRSRWLRSTDGRFRLAGRLSTSSGQQLRRRAPAADGHVLVLGPRGDMHMTPCGSDADQRLPALRANPGRTRAARERAPRPGRCATPRRGCGGCRWAAGLRPWPPSR